MVVKGERKPYKAQSILRGGLLYRVQLHVLRAPPSIKNVRPALAPTLTEQS